MKNVKNKGLDKQSKAKLIDAFKIHLKSNSNRFETVRQNKLFESKVEEENKNPLGVIS